MASQGVFAGAVNGRVVRFVVLVVFAALVSYRRSRGEEDAESPKSPPPILVATYKPYTAQQAPPGPGQPVALGYPGDMQTVMMAGEPIGTLVIQADGSTTDKAIDAKARRQADDP